VIVRFWPVVLVGRATPVIRPELLMMRVVRFSASVIERALPLAVKVRLGQVWVKAGQALAVGLHQSTALLIASTVVLAVS